MVSLFISYKHFDQRVLMELSPLLEEAGYNVWFDKELRGGQDWWNTILENIARCDVFIYLMSQDSIESPFCQAEYKEASRLRKRILPILVRGGVKLPPDLAKIQHEDISEGITPFSAIKITTQILRLCDTPVHDTKPLRPEPTPLPPENPLSQVTLLEYSLSSFPKAFSPLTVIVGDKREVPPKSPGDLLALSASTSDLRWILRMNLPRDVDIVSDKVLLKASDNYLFEKFGQKNLLVIGSPAANHIARLVNETTFFSFKISSRTRQEIKKLIDQSNYSKANIAPLQRYVDNLAHNGEAIRFYLNQLRIGGFIDPTYEFKTRGEFIGPDVDYGIISVCKNPYARSGNYVAVLAAGVHLPGTMQSLLMLADAENLFRERQLGGVFKVTLYEPDWAKRMEENVVVEWSTDPYTPADLRRGFEEIRQHFLLDLGMTEQDIANRLDFLAQLTNEKP